MTVNCISAGKKIVCNYWIWCCVLGVFIYQIKLFQNFPKILNLKKKFDNNEVQVLPQSTKKRKEFSINYTLGDNYIYLIGGLS